METKQSLGLSMEQHGLFIEDSEEMSRMLDITVVSNGEYRLGDVAYGHKDAHELALQDKFKGTLAYEYATHCAKLGLLMDETKFRDLVTRRLGTINSLGWALVLRLGDRIGDSGKLQKMRSLLPILLRNVISKHAVKHIRIITSFFFGERTYTRAQLQFNIEWLIELLRLLKSCGVTYQFVGTEDPDEDFLCACEQDRVMTTYGGFSQLVEAYGGYSQIEQLRGQALMQTTCPLIQCDPTMDELLLRNCYSRCVAVYAPDINAAIRHIAKFGVAADYTIGHSVVATADAVFIAVGMDTPHKLVELQNQYGAAFSVIALVGGMRKGVVSSIKNYAILNSSINHDTMKGVNTRTIIIPGVTYYSEMQRLFMSTEYMSTWRSFINIARMDRTLGPIDPVSDTPYFVWVDCIYRRFMRLIRPIGEGWYSSGIVTPDRGDILRWIAVADVSEIIRQFSGAYQHWIKYIPELRPQCDYLSMEMDGSCTRGTTITIQPPTHSAMNLYAVFGGTRDDIGYLAADISVLTDEDKAMLDKIYACDIAMLRRRFPQGEDMPCLQ